MTVAFGFLALPPARLGTYLGDRSGG